MPCSEITGNDLKHQKLSLSLRFKWKVDAQNPRATSAESDNDVATTHSPCFRFRGKRCRLSYRFHKDSFSNCLRLEHVNGGCKKPFDVAVHVKSTRTGNKLKQLTNKERLGYSCPPHIWIIWSKTEGDIVRAYPKVGNVWRWQREMVQDLQFKIVLTADGDYCPIKDIAMNHIGESSPVQTTSACLESLLKDLSKMLDQGPNPDVEFQVAGRSIGAHGAVVSARSEVFAAMFSSDMVEGRTRVVKIPDTQPDVFTYFLRYIYSGHLPKLTVELALGLYEIADKYAVLELVKRCSEYLVEQLSVDNACEILVAVEPHGYLELIDKVIEYILKNKIPAMADRWSAFSKDHPLLEIKVLRHFYASSLK